MAPKRLGDSIREGRRCRAEQHDRVGCFQNFIEISWRGFGGRAGNAQEDGHPQSSCPLARAQSLDKGWREIADWWLQLHGLDQGFRKAAPIYGMDA